MTSLKEVVEIAIYAARDTVDVLVKGAAVNVSTNGIQPEAIDAVLTSGAIAGGFDLLFLERVELFSLDPQLGREAAYNPIAKNRLAVIREAKGLLVGFNTAAFKLIFNLPPDLRNQFLFGLLSTDYVFLCVFRGYAQFSLQKDQEQPK